MKTRKGPSAALVVTMVFGVACGGLVAESDKTMRPTAVEATPPATLLPDGIWEAELTAEDLAGAGAAQDADPGLYRLTFDGARARIELDDGWQCDADAEADGNAVRLSWHPAMNCGGYDTIDWTVDGDGLHLELIATNGNEASTVAIFETKPYRPVEGDATLS